MLSLISTTIKVMLAVTAAAVIVEVAAATKQKWKQTIIFYPVCV